MRNQTFKLCGAGILAALVTLSGCHKSDPNAPDSSDPAAANLAPAGGSPNDSITGAGPAQQPNANPGYAPTGSSASSSASGYQGSQNSQGSMPPPPPEENGQQSSQYDSQSANAYPAGQSGSYDNAGYADQYADTSGGDPDAAAMYDQTTYADQPPPPLPEYQQPPCPGDNYMWTPGYWNYAQSNTQPGYFWVPGVWVVAPFIGALWTPGYWGADGARYGFHHGYWGHHIGFYGGIPYGYGYNGRGYEGGYWNRNQFFYNRSVTRINTTVVRNTYVHNVTINNYNNNRISYNGGRGGIPAHPVPYEQAAAREQHFAAVPAQRQYVQQAMANRAQFARNDGGHPQMLAAARPLAGRTVATAQAANLHPVVNQGGFQRTGRIGNPAQANQQQVQQHTQGNAMRALPGQAQVNRQGVQPNQQLQQRTQQNAQRAAQDQQRAQVNQQHAQQSQQKAQTAQQRVQLNQQRVQQAQQRPQPNAQRIQQDQQRVQVNQQRAQQNQAQAQQAQQRAQQNQQRAQQQQQQLQANQQRQAQQQQQRAQQQAAQRAQPRPAPQQPRPAPQQQRPAPQAQPRPQPQQQRPAPQAEPHPAPQQAPHAEAPHGGGSEHGHP